MKLKEDCAFELSYIKKEHDYCKDGMLIAQKRINHGKLLAKECPVDADFVLPMPETAIFYAQGYSLESRIPLVHAIFKNRPKPKTLFVNNREELIDKVFSVIEEYIFDKKIILVDETVISGLTLVTILKKIKKYNPKEIHLRLSNPPMIRKCPSSDFGDNWSFDGHELLNNELINSIGFLNVDIIEKSVECSYCFGGKNDKSEMVKY